MPARAGAVRWLVAVALVVGALPLVACLPAPFTDWPNHIARVFIGVRLLRGDPFWSQFYTLNPIPVPNEALDIGIGLLTLAGLTVDVAAMVFLVFAYAVFVAGFVGLARAFGARSATKPLLGATLFLSGPLMFGLVNYMLGLGVAMAFVGVWSRGGARRRWLMAIAATPLVFLVHLMGAAVWVLLIGCLEAPAWFSAVRGGWRAVSPRAVARGASSVGAGLVLVALVLASPVSADSLPRPDGSNIWYMGNESLFHLVRWKIWIFPRMVTDHASVPAIVGTFLALGGLLACLRLGGRLTMRPGAWLAFAGFLAAVVVLPESAGAGSMLDYRLSLVPILVAAAGIDMQWRRATPRAVALALLLLLVTGRAASFAADFAAEQPVYRDFDALANKLPKGGILLAAQGRHYETIPHDEWWSPPDEHLLTRAVYDDVFVPTVFALATQHAVVLKRAFAGGRSGWVVDSADHFAAMMRDIAPLCRATHPAFAEVVVFVAYPGPFVLRAVPRRFILASNDRFVMIDVCAPSGPLDPTAWSMRDAAAGLSPGPPGISAAAPGH